MGYLTDLIGSRAVDVVNAYAKSGSPFLLSLHFNAPHSPWEGPGDEAESERIRGKGTLMDFDGGTQKTYQRMIEDMDLQIGRVIRLFRPTAPTCCRCLRRTPHQSSASCSGVTRRTPSERRETEYKYLKILDNAFLFNVVEVQWSVRT
jgi:hypothetical protein